MYHTLSWPFHTPELQEVNNSKHQLTGGNYRVIRIKRSEQNSLQGVKHSAEGLLQGVVLKPFLIVTLTETDFSNECFDQVACDAMSRQSTLMRTNFHATPWDR